MRNVLDPRNPADHVKMMRAPDLWPLGQVLALRRDIPPGVFADRSPEDILCFDSDSELGVLVVHPNIERWTVIRLNMLDQRIRTVLFRGQIPHTVSFYTYMDAEGVFDAGWRVD